MLSTDGPPNSSVSQLRCTSVYGTESHASGNTRQTEEKRTEFNLRSDKSKARVTNNRRLRSTYCTIEANDRHEASRDFFATAELLVVVTVANFSTVLRTRDFVKFNVGFSEHWWFCFKISSHISKSGRVVSEEVTLQLVKSKCIPYLLYGLEVCELNKSKMASLDFTLTDFLWRSSAPVILKLLNLARNSLALNYLALCCPSA